MSSLTDLPIELLQQIPQYLDSIETFKDLSSSCRKLQSVFASTPPNIILRLAAASSRVFFRPHPYFLVAATARQVSDWALLSENNTYTLRSALRHGIEGLYELCLAKAGLTMDDIRRLHASRFTTLNPCIDLIDRCSGVQWLSTPEFWYGGVSDAETIYVEPERSLFQIAIYGELFASTMSATIDNRLGFDLDTRLDYVKYCIPDFFCWIGYEGLRVERGGPYVNAPDDVDQHTDQNGLRHVLKSTKWCTAWDTVRMEVGGDLEEPWRQKVWKAAVQMQGLEGLEMLRPGGVEKWRGRLMDMREKIAIMDPGRKPALNVDDGVRSLAPLGSPDLADEVFVCMRAMWL